MVVIVLLWEYYTYQTQFHFFLSDLLLQKRSLYEKLGPNTLSFGTKYYFMNRIFLAKYFVSSLLDPNSCYCNFYIP